MTESIPTYPDLAGKVAVVTGGSGGIGAATCRLLAANGAKVVVNGRDEAKVGAVVDEIGSNGGRAIGVTADVTDFAAIEQMRQQVEQELGPVEVLAAFAPRDIPHTFANLSGADARTLIICTPAGFERYFDRIAAREASGADPPPEASKPIPETIVVGPRIGERPGGDPRASPELRSAKKKRR